MVPKAVMQLLLQQESEGRGYRTEIARNVLCHWASQQTGKHITAYDI